MLQLHLLLHLLISARQRTAIRMRESERGSAGVGCAADADAAAKVR